MNKECKVRIFLIVYKIIQETDKDFKVRQILYFAYLTDDDYRL